MLKRALPPFGADRPVLLILGSLPGEASLAARAYYAHPRNQFWTLLGSAIGEPLAAMGYADRRSRLTARGILLWDVIGEARREGCLDGAIRAAVTRPLADLVAAQPQLRAIAFNGGTAARLGRRALAGIDAPALIDLPSSSPAYTLALAEKARAWAVLGEVALAGESGRIGA